MAPDYAKIKAAAEGYKADIIAVDMTGPHMLPATDPVSLLIYSAQASDVRMTMVDGKVLYEDGKFLTIDIDEAKKELLEASSRLYE